MRDQQKFYKDILDQQIKRKIIPGNVNPFNQNPQMHSVDLNTDNNSNNLQNMKNNSSQQDDSSNINYYNSNMLYNCNSISFLLNFNLKKHF